MRIWFNKTFSSVHNAFRLIKSADLDHRYTLLASTYTPHTLVKQAADEYFDEPKHSDNYLDWCLDFCKSQKVDILVAGRKSIELASAHHLFSEVNTRILSAGNSQVLSDLDNKALFYQQLVEDNNPLSRTLAPHSIAVTNYSEFQAAYQTLSKQYSQVCIKPSVGVYGLGFKIIKPNATAYSIYTSGNQYHIDLKSLDNMLQEQENFAPLLVMEFLPGAEYSVDCIADVGNMYCAIARCKSNIPGQGQTIDPREDIQFICQFLIKKYQLNGFINIQFREGENGLRVLEINPRLSGGVAMACLSGVNLPYLGLKGFDCGYDNIIIPKINHNITVGEYNKVILFN